MQVHICPSRTRLVAAANAAISVHASCVASCVGTGTVWKWSKTQIDSKGPSSAALAMLSMVGQWSFVSMPARSSRHPCGTKSPKRMVHHPMGGAVRSCARAALAVARHPGAWRALFPVVLEDQPPAWRGVGGAAEPAGGELAGRRSRLAGSWPGGGAGWRGVGRAAEPAGGLWRGGSGGGGSGGSGAVAVARWQWRGGSGAVAGAVAWQWRGGSGAVAMARWRWRGGVERRSRPVLAAPIAWYPEAVNG